MLIAKLVSLLLFVGIIVADDNLDIDCATCVYHNDIGYLTSQTLCTVYYECVRNPYRPDTFKHHLRCCPYGQRFDELFLTCIPDLKQTCEPPASGVCPDFDIITPSMLCDYNRSDDDPQKFIVPFTGEVLSCPAGQIFDPDYCTCIYGYEGGPVEKCAQLLNFDFSEDFNSRVCNNYAHGDQFGYIYPPDGGFLCLSGDSQFLSIHFLKNWFTNNPKALQFTMCVFFAPAVEGLNAGVLSTNCDINPNEGSLADFFLQGGVLKGYVGNTVQVIGDPVVRAWNRLCVTFDKGHEIIYFNEIDPIHHVFDSQYPIVSHSATTLGYLDGIHYTFYGYFDDFQFWPSVLSDAEIFAMTPTNSFDFVDEMM